MLLEGCKIKGNIRAYTAALYRHQNIFIIETSAKSRS